MVIDSFADVSTDSGATAGPDLLGLAEGCGPEIMNNTPGMFIFIYIVFC